MKIVSIIAIVLAYLAFAQAQAPTDPWQVVTDKLEATTANDNFFLFIGNDSGVIYTFQRGSINGSTILPIASASKWPMSVVIQRLLEDGILDLSTRPQDIIPWWTNDPSDPRSRVTVYHLLTFQSGFNNESGCLDNQDTISLEDCAKVIYDMNVSTEPGSAFYYGGNHMQVLGFMAQNKTGIDWKTLFSTYLTKPLQLIMRYSGETNPRMAGGIVSSAYDYGKLVRTLYLKQLLQPETITNMELDRTNVTIAYSAATAFNLEWHYAFGHWVECNSSVFLPICGTDQYHIRSSPGAFGFYPFIDRTNNFYGVLSTFGSQGGVSAGIVDSVREDIIAAIRGDGNSSRDTPTASPTSISTPLNNVNTTPSRTSRSSTLTFSFLLFLLLLWGMIL